MKAINAMSIEAAAQVMQVIRQEACREVKHASVCRLNQSINQSINQSSMQAINQSLNQPVAEQSAAISC